MSSRYLRHGEALGFPGAPSCAHAFSAFRNFELQGRSLPLLGSELWVTWITVNRPAHSRPISALIFGLEHLSSICFTGPSWGPSILGLILRGPSWGGPSWGPSWGAHLGGSIVGPIVGPIYGPILGLEKRSHSLRLADRADGRLREGRERPNTRRQLRRDSKRDSRRWANVRRLARALGGDAEEM